MSKRASLDHETLQKSINRYGVIYYYYNYCRSLSDVVNKNLKKNTKKLRYI